MGLPLDGIRVVSLAEQYPGPYATLLMADLGAEVILVERPSGGDPARQFPDFHAALARNKKSVALDLKSEEGRTGLLELVRSADVLLEGFRPGTMGRLGFGYDAAAALNPRLVYVSISGFGQTGPYQDRPAHDISYSAMAGLFFRQAASGEVASPGDMAFGDLSSAMFATVGTLAALVERGRTGRGTYVDVSMTDGLVSWMSVLLGPVMNGGSIAAIGAEPGYGFYRARDGRLLSLSVAHEDWFWKPLCRVLGLDDVSGYGHAERVAHEAALRRRIAGRVAEADRDDWGRRFDEAGVPWGPVHSLEEVAADPHFRARGLFTTARDGDGRERRHVAQPLVWAGTRPGPRTGVPALGEHTEDVLAGLRDPRPGAAISRR